MVHFRLGWLVHLAFLIGTATAQATSTTTTYPSTTSSPTLVQEAYAYNPSEVAAGIFAGLYGITTLILFFRLFANRTWWGLCLPIGSAVMTAGFILRILMILHPNSEAYYLCSLLFILLSPAAFLAFNYILYGRFIVNCMLHRYSLIRPERTARYFVISDITTILVQGTGGSFLSSTNSQVENIGLNIILSGLVLQTVSYGLFILLMYRVFWSLKRDGVNPFQAPWSMIFKTLSFSSAFFLLRCIYRTIEFADGLGQGYLIDHEVFFYVFDALPLLVGVCAYIFYWPSRYLHPSEEKIELTPPETQNVSEC